MPSLNSVASVHICDCLVCRWSSSGELGGWSPRGAVGVLVWGSWRAAMCAWCGGGRLCLTGGLLGPFLRTLTRLVAVWARRPHCHLKGPAVNRRASTATYGAQLRRGGGIATIGGSGRRVVGVSRAYGSNSPVWIRAAAAARSTTRRGSRNSPRLEPCRSLSIFLCMGVRGRG